MNTVTQIEHLLEREWDYSEALEIYRVHGSNIALYNLLKKDPNSSFFNKKLRDELESLYSDLSSENSPGSEVIPEQSISKTAINHQSPVHIEDWPEALQSVIKKRNQCLKHRDHLRGKLTTLFKPEDLKDAALKILDLDDEISDCWDTIDYYLEHGDLPPAVPEDKMEKLFAGKSQAQISKMLTNNRTYLTKARKGQRSADLIPVYESVILECERRLGND